VLFFKNTLMQDNAATLLSLDSSEF